MSTARTRGQALVSVQGAAMAGIGFSLLFVASVLLMRSGLPGFAQSPDEVQARLSEPGAQQQVVVGLTLAAFASICFLWFVAVLHRRIPPHDRFVSVVFLGGAILFVAIYAVSAALLCGPHYVHVNLGAPALDPGITLALQSVGYGLMFVVGVRVEVLVILSATTIARHFGVLPRWLVWFGYLIALVQLVNVTLTALTTVMLLAFPIWVLAVSLTIMIRHRDARSAGGSQVTEPA